MLAVVLIGAATAVYGVVAIAAVVSAAQLVESLVCLQRRDTRRLGIFTWLFTATFLWMLAAQPLTSLLTSWNPWLPIVLGCLVPLWAMLAALVDLQFQHENPPASQKDTG
jgi:hypothetical protein